MKQGTSTKNHEIWARVGVSFNATEEEIAAILSGDDEDMKDVLKNLLDSGRYEITGETYIPVYSVDEYNEENGTNFDAREYVCNM